MKNNQLEFPSIQSSARNSGETPSARETPDETLEEITCTVERIIYVSAPSEDNEKGEYAVLKVRTIESEYEFTAVGPLADCSVGHTIKLRGRWENHKKFGQQFHVHFVFPAAPPTLEALKRYLSSGHFKGIGKEMAARIVEKFGMDTPRILEEEPSSLEKVPGIGKKRSLAISEAWKADREKNAIMLFLAEKGLSSGIALKIWRRYGSESLEKLKKNPYILADDIYGIGFRKANEIALRMGIEPGSLEQMKAGIRYMLLAESTKGHTRVLAPDLRHLVGELGIPLDKYDEACEKLVESGKLVFQDGYYYLRKLYQAEREAAERIKTILETPFGGTLVDITDTLISKIEHELSIVFSDGQKEALRKAQSSKLFLLTGKPGTGKTTALRGLVRLAELSGLKLALAAPTGRAAKRMEETTGRPALTVHRLLKYDSKNRNFFHGQENPLPYDVVIVDESSMLDIELARSLLVAIKDRAKLFLVGDPNQLESIGAGDFLRDLIRSRSIPHVELAEIFRQAASSLIVMNAHRILEGGELENGRDPERDNFFFFRKESSEEAFREVMDLVTNPARIQKRFGFDPIRDIQVLSPMRKRLCGVDNLNRELARILNRAPDGLNFRGMEFRRGDKVMQIENDYEKDIFNGDIGYVTRVYPDENLLFVDFGGREIEYSPDDLHTLTLAYAVTVHKSQGSEYPAVVMPFLGEHRIMFRASILYTALTRARKLMVIVGQPWVLKEALRERSGVVRSTGLLDRLRELSL